MSEDHIPFLSLHFQHNQLREEILEAVEKVYDENRFIFGNELKAFEQEFASYIGVPYCIGVGNGLDALTLSLKCLQLSPSDEVIVPAHTFMATWLAVVRAGAKPIAVDADPMTFNMKPELLEGAVTPRTKAIVPVHMYGQACDMTAVLQLADQYKISVVEDNAQGHGARWLQKRTGSVGAINATSFYPTKNLGALGDGGAVTTFDADFASLVKRYRNYGFDNNYQALDEGMNSRLDELQAAVLRRKLRSLDANNDLRRRIAEFYLQRLEDLGELQLPRADKESYHVYHLFVVLTQRRDQLRDHLKKHGIDTMIHYPVPPHLQPVFRHRGYRVGDFPEAERIAETCLSLPAWPGMTETMVEKVCSTIRQFFK